MFVAFTLEGLAICLLIRFAGVPIMFVLLTGLAFFAWGEIYSLFPALCGDLFGANSPRRTTACSTPPREPPRYWCRWQAIYSRRPGAGRPFSCAPLR